MYSTATAIIGTGHFKMLLGVLVVFAIVLSIKENAAEGVNISKICGPNAFFESEGDLNVGFIVRDCQESQSQLVTTLASSAVWTIERLNFLEYTSPVKLGISVYKVCNGKDYLNAVFQLFRSNDDDRLLGIFGDRFEGEVEEMCDVLEIDRKIVMKYHEFLVKTAVKVLIALEWKENITVVASDEYILKEFYRATRRDWLCVKNSVSLSSIASTLHSGPTVIFGNIQEINTYLDRSPYNPDEEAQMIFVPLDGSQINELPEFSYVVQPPHVIHNVQYENPVNIINSPLLLEIAAPIINFAQNISSLIANICNDTVHNASCLAKHLAKYPLEDILFTPSRIVEILKIDHLKSKFVYNVFRTENLSISDNPTPVQTFVKVFTYSIFDELLINLETNQTIQGSNATIPKTFCSKSFDDCILECVNFEATLTKTDPIFNLNIWLRNDPWIFGCLSVALLGVVFCIAIFLFLMSRICKRDILEGNPVLTILLLLVTTFMFLSVFFLTIEGDETTNESICLCRTLSITLCYAAAFSLLLGRTILLGNASKEIGFMSHVAGPVQSFLTIFIFAVQCALDIQLLHDCRSVTSDMFLYILSYNVILLILLICLCPLIFRSRRNYKEGKYFVMAVSLLTCTWSSWLPMYVLIGVEWKDLALSFGLITTGAILLATIFIPRTYQMAIAEAKDQLTSALPSLATAASTLDMFRSGNQAIYDCVNITAVTNSSNLLRSHALPEPEPKYDFSSLSALPDEEDLDFTMSKTPTPDDKVTRF